MSLGSSLGNGQRAHSYTLDQPYIFDEGGYRYSPQATSTGQVYYYPSVPMLHQGGQPPHHAQQQPYPAVYPPYQTHNPRFLAQQTNQTLTALASARRQPPEHDLNQNPQGGDPSGEGHPYYTSGQRDYPHQSGGTNPSEPVYPSYPPPSTSPTHLPLTKTQIISPSYKTSEGHACSYCGKTFGRPSAVKIHMAIHTGEKAFTCPATGCHRKFSVRSNMSRHIRNVHQSWPYDNDGDFECSNDGAEEPDDARRY